MRTSATLPLTFLLTLIVVLLSSCGPDPCLDVQCDNGGVCLDGSCICAAGYEGSSCGTEMRSKFLNDYVVVDTCDTVGTSYACTLSADSSEVIRILFSNFADLSNLGVTTPLYGLVNGTALTLPEQTRQDRTYKGSATLDATNGLLTLNYTIRDTTENENLLGTCEAVYTPQ